MRRKEHGSESIGLSQAAFEAGVKFGEFYSALEAHIDAFRKSEGSAFSLHEIRTRVDQLLEAKEVREGLLDPQLVSQMRHVGAGADQRGGTGIRAYEQSSNSHFHVQPRDRKALRPKPSREQILGLREQGLNGVQIAEHFGWSKSVIDKILYSKQKRNLSAASRKAIGDAQRRRWADPGHRKQRIAALKQAGIERSKAHYAQTPEGRRQRSEAMKKRWQNPAFRKKTMSMLTKLAKKRRGSMAAAMSKSWREKFPTPEARSAEAMRRRAVAAAKKQERNQ